MADRKKRLQALGEFRILFSGKEQSHNKVAGRHSIHRMGVVLMKHFDFKDLMSFGMFLIALLTFIFMFMK